MSALVKLSELAINQPATIREFPKTGVAFTRLKEMGLLIGTPVKLVRIAPMGDPIEIKVRGYSLTLRKSEAADILVEPVTAS